MSDSKFPKGEDLKLTCLKPKNAETLYITFDGIKYSSWKLIDGKYVKQKSIKDPTILEKKFWEG